MKKTFRILGQARLRAGFLAILLVVTFLAVGCSKNDEIANVRTYNNQIVDIQQKMLQRAQDTSKFLSTEQLDPVKAADELVKVLSDVQQTNDQFKALQVPKGGEDLAASMKRFFDVEVTGLNILIASLRNLQSESKDSQAVQSLMAAVDDFSKQENDALVNFDDVQSQTAKKYGQEVTAGDAGN